MDIYNNKELIKLFQETEKYIFEALDEYGYNDTAKSLISAICWSFVEDSYILYKKESL